MKLKAFAFLSILLASQIAGAQEEPKPVIKPVQYFIGIQPGVKPVLFNDYGQYAWDINLIPITIKYAMNRHWALRIHSIWDIEFRPENYPAVLSTVGVEIAAQYHLALKNSEEGHRGFFVAPVITPAYHKPNNYYSLGVGGEAGFSFLFGYKWSLTISAQAGTYLQMSPNNSYLRIVPYSIPIVVLGIWL